MIDQLTYKDPVNEVLERLQGDIRTQDLSPSDVRILEDKFGEGWFFILGYDKIKTHKYPHFEFYS